MGTQKPCELFFSFPLRKSLTGLCHKFLNSVWTAGGIFNNTKANNKLLHIFWETGGGVRRVHWSLCFLLTFSFSSTLILLIHWSRWNVLITLTGAQQAPQLLLLSSTRWAPAVLTSVCSHLAQHPLWPSPPQREPQAYQYHLDILQFIFFPHFKTLVMHSSPQHCKVGIIPM